MGFMHFTLLWLERFVLEANHGIKLSQSGLGLSGQFIRLQGLNAAESQIVQEMFGGCKQCRPAHRLFVTDDFHPATVLQLFDHQGIDGHASNVFHVGTRDRLSVRNDGQGF